MKIIKIRPAPAGSGNIVARFDAEIAEGVKAYGLKLVQSERGLRVFGPSISGGSAITFAPAIADALAQLANGEVAHHVSSQ
ncbi:MAG: hypothetical protein KKG78_02310 [Alphaproteobacteria bacterium]|nr:hypothetical protein [Alphaproteobacteria bacterium]